MHKVEVDEIVEGLVLTHFEKQFEKDFENSLVKPIDSDIREHRLKGSYVKLFLFFAFALLAPFTKTDKDIEKHIMIVREFLKPTIAILSV